MPDVRDVLATRMNADTAKIAAIIDRYDEGATTKAEMIQSIRIQISSTIGHSFDLGFQIGVSAPERDLDPDESLLDLPLDEIDPEETP